MYFKRFQQGDEVMYTGDKLTEIRGKLAHVVSRVGGSESGVCIDVEGDSYIVDEQQHLAKFIKKERPEGDKSKGPAAEKRRGVSEKGGGKKRRKQEEG